MRVRIRSDGSIVELDCDAYAIFDRDAGLVLVSDHTLIETSDVEDMELVWIV